MIMVPLISMGECAFMIVYHAFRRDPAYDKALNIVGFLMTGYVAILECTGGLFVAVSIPI